MALIRQLRHQALEKDSRHTEAECIYSIVTDKHGHKLLQIDPLVRTNANFAVRRASPSASQRRRFSS